VSFPCGLEHLRRCTGSTRWWSVDWHRCQARYPRFVHFSWSFLVNWYIQSIFYTPQSSQSHSYLLRFFTSMRNCRLVSVSSKLSNTYQWHQTPSPSTPSITFTFPTSVWCYWSTTLSSDTTHLVHAMTCILPHSFLSKPFISFPGELRTIHSYSLRLLLALHNPTVYRFSLPTRCGWSLLSFIQTLHLDRVLEHFLDLLSPPSCG